MLGTGEMNFMKQLTLNDLHSRGLRFHEEYLLDQTNGRQFENELNRLREEFIAKYTVNYINNELTIENYSIGTGDKTTFSYLIERSKLAGFGSARGGYSTKFGVYFSGKKQAYDRDQHYPEDVNEAFNVVKRDLITIIEAASEDNIEKASTTKFWYIIKYKVYNLYNPEHDIPVFKREHVEEIIRRYKISSPRGDIEKRRALYSFKANDEVFSQMSNREFMSFIYSPYSGLNLKEDEEAENELEIIDEEPEKPLEDFIGVYVNNELVTKTNKLYKNHRTIVAHKTDFLELNKKKQTLGKFGEMLIINDETTKLNNLGIEMRVEHSSLEIGDGLGYDIKSYGDDREEIYIEVKTTASNIVDGFHLTKREKEFAATKPSKYFIYRVYDLDKNKGTYKVRIYKYLFNK